MRDLPWGEEAGELLVLLFTEGAYLAVAREACCVDGEAVELWWQERIARKFGR